jgi:hypothetical protein
MATNTTMPGQKPQVRPSTPSRPKPDQPRSSGEQPDRQPDVDELHNTQGGSGNFKDRPLRGL